jgi:plasmid stabilization system protein ParE
LKARADFTVEIGAQAEEDLVDVAAWYDERHPTGHDRFLRDFGQALGTMRTFPGAGQQRNDVRERMRSHYVHPYLVFYDVNERDRIVTIIRVLYGRMDITREDFD